MKSVYHGLIGIRESYKLNQPIDCPDCGGGVRNLGGKLVEAAKSSPYDGEFDLAFHVEHVCKTESTEVPF